MTNSHDAAEQIVRVSLDGASIVLRLTGTAIKELATFIAAAAKNPERKKKKEAAKCGKARLKEMLKCSKPTEIFSIKEENLQKFVEGAKHYGIRYCVVKNPKDCPDNLCDIMIKADDAPKVARIADRHGFSTITKANIEHERERAVERQQAAEVVAKSDSPNKERADALVDGLMGNGKENAKAPGKPDLTKTADPSPSASLSTDKRKSETPTSYDNRPSVRRDLDEIKTQQKKTQKTPEMQRETKHKQPNRKKKTKAKRGQSR